MSMVITPKHKFFELSDHVSSISKPLNTHLGISYFTFKRTYNDGSKIYLFNHPLLYEDWFKNKHFLIGNKEAAPSAYRSSYDLWEALPDPYNLYQKVAEDFNIGHGLTITKSYDNYCDFFFFGTSCENPEVKKIYFNRREVLDNYCEYFLETAAGIIKDAEKSKIILPFAPKIEVISKEKNIDNFLQEISMVKNNWSKLTKREMDCVHQLMFGKTNKEIALTLGISYRTVEEYIDNIKRKTNCKNKAELIAFLYKNPSVLTIY